MINSVVILGRLTKDADVKQIPTGSFVISMSVAVNRRYKTKDGKQKDDSYFFDVEKVVHSTQGIEKYLKKGTPLIIEGQLRQQRWTNKDGKNSSKVYIFANKIELLPKTKKEQPVIDENIDIDDEDLPF